MSLTSKTHPYKAASRLSPATSTAFLSPIPTAEKKALLRKLSRIIWKTPSSVPWLRNPSPRDRRTCPRRRRLHRSARAIISSSCKIFAASTAFCSSPTKYNPASPALENGSPLNISASSLIDYHGEIAGRWHAHRRGHWPRRNHGAPGVALSRHLLWTSSFMRRRARRHRNHRERRSARAFHRHRQTL